SSGPDQSGSSFDVRPGTAGPVSTHRPCGIFLTMTADDNLAPRQDDTHADNATGGEHHARSGAPRSGAPRSGAARSGAARSRALVAGNWKMHKLPSEAVAWL